MRNWQYWLLNELCCKRSWKSVKKIRITNSKLQTREVRELNMQQTSKTEIHVQHYKGITSKRTSQRNTQKCRDGKCLKVENQGAPSDKSPQFEWTVLSCPSRNRFCPSQLQTCVTLVLHLQYCSLHNKDRLRESMVPKSNIALNYPNTDP